MLSKLKENFAWHLLSKSLCVVAHKIFGLFLFRWGSNMKLLVASSWNVSRKWRQPSWRGALQ